MHGPSVAMKNIAHITMAKIGNASARETTTLSILSDIVSAVFLRNVAAVIFVATARRFVAAARPVSLSGGKFLRTESSVFLFCPFAALRQAVSSLSAAALSRRLIVTHCTPRVCESFSVFTAMFCFCAMSAIVNATTTGRFVCNSCVVRYRLRSGRVQSTTFIITSGGVFVR